jgi:hypothetical protein
MKNEQKVCAISLGYLSYAVDVLQIGWTVAACHS